MALRNLRHAIGDGHDVGFGEGATDREEHAVLLPEEEAAATFAVEDEQTVVAFDCDVLAGRIVRHRRVPPDPHTRSPASVGSDWLLAAAPAGNAGGAASAGNDPNTPARAMVKMTKADLQNAPEFRYANDQNRTGAAGNTNPPPQNVNTPGNTPPNAPRQ